LGPSGQELTDSIRLSNHRVEKDAADRASRPKRYLCEERMPILVVVLNVRNN